MNEQKFMEWVRTEREKKLARDAERPPEQRLRVMDLRDGRVSEP